MGDNERVVAALSRILPAERILTGPAAERAYDCDAYTVDRSRPSAVVIPTSTEDVAAIVRWCVSTGTPYTPRGAGTGLSGGVLPALGGVVISTKGLNSILEIDPANRVLKAQTGVTNRRLSDAVAEYGLHFAPDPSSQTVSTLGGNIAENAGGPHTLKYGVTHQHVLGLTVVDCHGDIREIGGPVGGAPGPDWVGLMVGSEGTLGVVTEAWIRLTPVARSVETALVAFRDVADATRTVAEIIGGGVVPAALELIDRGIIFALQAAFGLEFPLGTDALLLVECDGDDPATVRAEMDAVTGVCLRHGAIDVRLAANEKERAQLWLARKKGVGAMGRIAPTVVTHDGVIPRSRLPEMLDFVYQVAAEANIGIANIFHAGDGNLHPCFYFDDRDPDQVRRVVEAGEKLIRRCIELGGSITGEHGVGVEKLDLMSLMFDEPSLAFQAKLKRALNPENLCNPCKVLPNQRSCVEHRMRWRGTAW